MVNRQLVPTIIHIIPSCLRKNCTPLSHLVCRKIALVKIKMVDIKRIQNAITSNGPTFTVELGVHSWLHPLSAIQ